VRSVTGAYLQPGFVDSNGKGVYRGKNPDDGALFTVWVKEFTGDEIKVSITKSTGQPVANLKAPGTPGFTRLNWDLRPTKDVSIEYGGDDPKTVVAGGRLQRGVNVWADESETKFPRRHRRRNHAALTGDCVTPANAAQHFPERIENAIH